MTIQITQPEQSDLKAMRVFDWPIWEKGVSEFPWSYDDRETCYIIQGQARVVPDSGANPVTIKAGDLVIFPKGLQCRWQIIQPIKKHYQFG
ncbi:MAG: DUF861 domain-containing protein [Candidatus Moranbacteria bacterium]|nr:DUF861 domain-containing protein [Candidatus Moranbacteria bacterium]